MRKGLPELNPNLDDRASRALIGVFVVMATYAPLVESGLPDGESAAISGALGLAMFGLLKYGRKPPGDSGQK